MTRPPNRFKRGKCKECHKDNVLIKDGACIDCIINNARLETQSLIKEEGLKFAQIQWESMKPEIEKRIEDDYQELSDEDKKEWKKGTDKLFQTIEDDLFPERKKARESRKNWLIIGAVILVIIVLGGIAYWWYKSSKKDEEFKDKDVK